jgi:hypothetical protein
LQTGIRGNVTLGPTCPVEMPGQPPCVEPLEASLRIECPDGADIRTIRSAADGTFEIRLPPGDFVIVPLPVQPGSPFPSAPAPVSIAVPADGFVEVQIAYDTGIR